jgi:hypothetical protein
VAVAGPVWVELPQEDAADGGGVRDPAPGAGGGWGIRRAAREFGVSRNTVRRDLAGAEPGVRKPAERARPVFECVRSRIDEILADSARWTQGKQRLTATQLHRMLVGEGHAVGATLVKQYVAEWKRQRREVYVPLDYPPGDLGEVATSDHWRQGYLSGLQTKRDRARPKHWYSLENDTTWK